MKTQLKILSLLLPAACASGVDNATVAQPSPTGAYYCLEDKAFEAEGKLVCNWTAERREACRSSRESYIELTALKAPPGRAGRCANGQAIATANVR